MNIKDQTYYFFNDNINIENFDPNNVKIDEKSGQNILIYQIGYVTIKKLVKMYSVKPMYLIFRYVNGYFEEIMEINIRCQFLLMRARKKLKNMKNCRLKSEI